MFAYVSGNLCIDGIPVGLEFLHLRFIGCAVLIELPDIGVRLLNVLVDLILFRAQLLSRGCYIPLPGNQCFLLLL